MNTNEKRIAVSAATLAGILFVAWYFSWKNRRAGIAAAQPGAPETQPSNAYTFNVPPLDVPGLTIPTFPTLPPTLPSTAPPPNTCCERCAKDSDLSAGKIISLGSFVQSVFHATQLAAPLAQVPQSVQAQAQQAPIGDLLIRQYNGGLPLPVLSWWAIDPIYRTGYAIAYNRVAADFNITLATNHYKKNAIRPISYNMTGPGDFNAVADQVTYDGANIGTKWNYQYGGPGGGNEAAGDPQALENGSYMTYVAVKNALEDYMRGNGDTLLGQSQGFQDIGVPDQPLIVLN